MRVRLLLLLTVLELGVLGFMAGQREWVLRYGRTVTLRTEPVDPSDPLRGEYARLGYSFSSVTRSEWPPAVYAAASKLCAAAAPPLTLKVHGLKPLSKEPLRSKLVPSAASLEPASSPGTPQPIQPAAARNNAVRKALMV